MTSTHFTTGHCAKSHPTKIIKFPQKIKKREKISDFLFRLFIIFHSVVCV